ncbi:MAG TPA: hypothetical protein VFW09_05975 [Solirubrobacteraceae bacterium]|nr:hypothetical protein [Solirubrobacteraceae bacterium]
MAVLEQTTARAPARPISIPARPRRPATPAWLQWAAPTLVAALLAAVYVAITPTSVDLAAHLFRAQMFSEHGFQIWNNYWYAGNEVLGYSVLFPAVSALPTPQLAAALATTGTATVFTPLARRHFGDRAWVGALLFGAATAADLYSGRLAFAFGALPALGAIAALDDDHPALACVLALVSALCSPVAALFAALVAAGHALGGAIVAGRDRMPGRTTAETVRPVVRAVIPGTAVIVAALGPILVISWMFPQGGVEPFAFSTMLPLLVICALALVVLPRELVRLRAGVAVYGIATLAVYLIPTPIGSNIARMATFSALPLVTLVWWGRRPRALALVFLPLLYVAWSPAVRDGIAADIDESASTSYYAPLLHWLHRESAPGTTPFRIEVPFTQFHWEAYEVATRYSLARGWERQLDIRYNPLFYEGRLTAARYRRWLHADGVRFVAISDATPDYSARAEVRLIDSGLPYLHLVFRSQHWRVYRVANATPIVQPPAVLQRLDADSLTMHVSRPEAFKVRVHFTPYWKLSEGSGCVAPDGQWTKITARHAGELKLVPSFSLSRIGSTTPRCSS